ncbi:Aminotransferase, class III [hydrothermal vent metagenome]|uniref:Aminotransferase, class III n=1 Tax=hydrothermal vent metagenome TaxID=652676 RepID=A0A3B0RPP4_9ZZZZ
MTAVFYRGVTATYPKAVRAEGMYIFDEQNKQYLDMSGGAAVSCVGHQHPQVVAALCDQIQTMSFAHTAFFSNEPQEQLAEKITGKFGEENAKVYFTSGGSEANETAFKLVWQYWRAKGRPTKKKIISRHHSYHGNTYGALSISGNLPRRRVMGDILIDWPRIDPCYAYRNLRQGESSKDYGLRAAKALEDMILLEGAENIAAFIAEPVVGASLGVVTAAPGYFKRIREICDAHDILLISDEIMCGTGRTGTFFAHEQENFLPDIVTLAKGIAGGYQPLAATLTRAHIHETFVTSGKGFDHGHTYVGHASACAAGLAVLNVIDQENLLDNVQKQGDYLQAALEDAFGDHPYVGDIRGRGLFRGIEIVADKQTKAPFPDDLKITKRLKQATMKQGLICYPGGGSYQDNLGSHILLAPPFIVQPDHIDQLIEKLRAMFDEVLDV